VPAALTFPFACPVADWHDLDSPLMSDYRPSRSAGHDRSAPAEYDEYEGADDFDDDQPPRRAPSASSSRRPNPPPKSEPRQKDVPKATEAPAPKAKEVNLFDFDDDEPAPASAPAPAAAAPAASSNILGGDGEFALHLRIHC